MNGPKKGMMLVTRRIGHTENLHHDKAYEADENGIENRAGKISAESFVRQRDDLDY